MGRMSSPHVFHMNLNRDEDRMTIGGEKKVEIVLKVSNNGKWVEEKSGYLKRKD